MKIVQLTLLALSSLAWPLAAQAPAFDNSGNGLLKGTYYFRQLVPVISDNAGDFQDLITLYGNITFDGNGNYTINPATSVDAANNTISAYSSTGTYSISASGYGFLSTPLTGGDSIYGLVSQGIFIGSSTEGGYNDLFIAAPVASPQATNSTLKGTYSVAYINFPVSSDPEFVNDASFQMNADGNGNLGKIG